MNLGLRIKPVNAEAFDIWGYAYWKYVEGKKYWYCAGSSFPAEIVEKVYEVSLKAEEIYKYAESIGKIV